MDVAPGPVVARLDGFDDGVAGFLEVLAGVASPGGVAATHVAADHAHA